MPQEISPGLFRIEVPLPKNPLKTLNSYIIVGERNLIVDTGFNRPECLAAMRAGLEELSIDLARTDFFITHLHADHAGLIGTLNTDSSRVWCSVADAEVINRVAALTPDDPWWEEVLVLARSNGFSAEQAEEAVRRHPGFRLGPVVQTDFLPVNEGDTFAYGGYHFQAMATPGHTSGHMCLYEAARKILISGDHVLGDITPNITPNVFHWRTAFDPLANYLNSLAKVATLDVSLVLPGHRQLIQDCRARVRELEEHHRRRAAEVVGIIAAGSMTAYQVASQMTWDMTYRQWEDFPPPQKWFAVGEAIAHLRYVAEKGLANRDERDGVILYSQREGVPG